MKTIILVANEDEAKHLSDLNCNIIITGEGRSNVIETIAEVLKNDVIEMGDRVINVGYVGAKGFDKGNIVQVGKVEHMIPSKTIKEKCIAIGCPFNFQTVECYTSDDFVDADDVNPWMPEKFVCDMELYYLALMFPSIESIKIVSDTLDYDEYKQADFKESWEAVKKELKNIINKRQA